MPADDSRDQRLDALLRALPQREIASALDAKVLRRARTLLEEERPSGLLQGLISLWERALAPLLITGTVATYLVWAVHSTSALYR